jgi:hypothetical protein
MGRETHVSWAPVKARYAKVTSVGAIVLGTACGGRTSLDAEAGDTKGHGGVDGGGGDRTGPSAGSGSAGTADMQGGAGGGGNSGGSCEIGRPTWSCAPAVITGPCCDANGSRDPQCSSACNLEKDPEGAPCEAPGKTTSHAVVAGVSNHCKDVFFACYVSNCMCGCRSGAIASVPGLSSCNRTLFANANHFPQSIAISGDFVYWTVAGLCPLTDMQYASGRIVGARRTDGSAAVAIPSLPCPLAIAAIDDDLYWTTNPGFGAGSVWTARSNGENVRMLAKGVTYGRTIQADLEDIYWSDSDGIYKLPRDGSGSTTRFASIDYPDSQVTSIFVLDDRFVYWIDDRPLDGLVLRAAKSGGAPEELATARHPLAIALSSEGLFWLDSSGIGQVDLYVLASGGGSPMHLATLTERSHGLSAFGTEAYWVDGDGNASGNVYRIGIGESAPSVVAQGEPGPVTTAADDKYLFWANVNYDEIVGADGEIVRICR